MSNMSKLVGSAIVAAAMSGCISHGPDGVAYSTGGTQSVGATGGSATGVLPGSGSPPAEKEQRGTPPVGTDREGHGPAAGAIVDPTGAATRGKPY